MSPLGRNHRKNPDVRPILYYSWPEKEKEAGDVIELCSKRKCLLLSIRDLHSYSGQAFNNFYTKVENEPEFENLVAQNGKEIVADLSDHRFCNILSVIENTGTKQDSR